jgi:hypothetical protein
MTIEALLVKSILHKHYNQDKARSNIFTPDKDARNGCSIAVGFSRRFRITNISFRALAQKGFGTKVPLGERDSDPSAEADGN